MEISYIYALKFHVYCLRSQTVRICYAPRLILQWVKKPSQCLAVLQRLNWNKLKKLSTNLEIIYVIVYHLGFTMHPWSCDLDQNWCNSKQNKTHHHWDSFLTFYNFSNILSILTKIGMRLSLKVIKMMKRLYLYMFDTLNLHQPLFFLSILVIYPFFFLSTLIISHLFIKVAFCIKFSLKQV